MRKFLSFLSILCPVGAGVIIYAAVSEIFAWQDINKITVLVISAVFAVAASVLCLACSALFDRVTRLERALDMYSDSPAEDGEREECETKECPVCKKEIDSAYPMCPYCGNREFENDADMFMYGEAPDLDVFKTQREDYNGTDYSDSDIVSANFDITNDSADE